MLEFVLLILDNNVTITLEKLNELLQFKNSEKPSIISGQLFYVFFKTETVKSSLHSKKTDSFN